MTNVGVIGSKQLLKSYDPELKDPHDYLHEGKRKIVYVLKQSLYFVGRITESPCGFATILRKITECIGPSFAYLGNFMSQWNAAARDFVGAVNAADMLELVNDANYFLNGGFAKDKAKKHHYSVLAHVALVPTNIITVMLFLQNACNVSLQFLGTFANALGNIRVFGFVPKLASLVQHWPLFRSIPNLAGKAAWIGNVRIFGFISKCTLSMTATVLCAAAYLYFGVDSWMRMGKYKKKVDRDFKALQERHITVKPSDTCLIEKLDALKMVDQTKREEAGKAFIKYKHNLIKAKQANLDFWASGVEFTIKLASIGGLVAGVTTAGSVTFGVLGLIALVSVGRCVYHKMTTSKPDLRAVIG